MKIKVKRGINLPISEISEIGVNRYFNIGNIGYGFVCDQSVFVKEISKYSSKKIFSANHDYILLGRVGNPKTKLYKIAVVNEPHDFMISDNLFCLDVDNPYYVMSYLLSNDERYLKSLSSVADDTPFLSISKIKNFEIPSKSKKEIEKIEKSYKKMLEDFLKKSEIAQKAQENLKNVYL